MNQDFYNSNLSGFDQFQPPQFPVNYPPQETSKEILQAQEDLMEAIQAFLKEYDHIPPNEKCMALLLAEERFLKIKQTMEEEQNQPEVMQELLLKLMNDLQILKGIQQEKKETATQSFKETDIHLRERTYSFKVVNPSTKQEIDQGLGSTSGIRACALRNFDLEVMELENTQNNALAKLPMLKLGEYEMWEIRIKQYFQIQDYALWEVIENGNSWVPIPVTTPPESGTSTTTKMTVPATIEEKTCKKNDVKTRSLLLMALPNEHQLTFDQYVDAQSMFATIKARFGGNEATKKTQKALLKQQYENFSASSSESLDSIFNRLQKLVSRLEISGLWFTPPKI
ncbi:hypothetical protein Tco_1336990 [Tanacetum coccineum]